MQIYSPAWRNGPPNPSVRPFPLPPFSLANKHAEDVRAEKEEEEEEIDYE